MTGDSALPTDDQGNVLVPRSLMDQIADALLFYVRGFDLLDEGLATERVEPRPVLLEDLGERAARAFEELGDEIMGGALNRTTPADG